MSLDATITDKDIAAPAFHKPAGTAARRRPTLRRVLLAGGLTALLAGAAFYGHAWWTNGRFIETTDDAYVGGDITTIAPRIGGLVTKVAVADNQIVHAGDLLMSIDDRDFRAQLARAEAAVASQQAMLANLDATRSLQLAMIEQAKAAGAFADAETARTRFDFERYQTLSDNRNASEQRFQQADADNKKAMATARKARAAIEAEERRVAVIDTQKRQALAALDQAVADRDLAWLSLGYTEIRAPIDGVVGNRSVRVGAYATPGAAMMALVPTDGLWIDGNFKESQIAGLRPGQTVVITADVLPGERFSGRVVSLAPATGAQFSVLPAENATGNFTKVVQRVPVRIAIEGTAAMLGRLRPGPSVTAAIDVREGSPSAGTIASNP